MKRRLFVPIAVVVVASCTFGASAAVPTSATATLVKGGALAIEIEGNGDDARSFTLGYHPHSAAPLADRGSALRVVASRATRRCADGTSRLRLAGTELLEGARGTLTLRWSGIRHKCGGPLGAVTGIWSVAGGTGIYAGNSGRGRFTSDSATTEYLGWLITAQ
jgi:hypothetical protein